MKSEQYREKKILIFTPNSAGRKTILLPHFTQEQCGYSKLVARGKDFQKLVFSKKKALISYFPYFPKIMVISEKTYTVK